MAGGVAASQNYKHHVILHLPKRGCNIDKAAPQAAPRQFITILHTLPLFLLYVYVNGIGGKRDKTATLFPRVCRGVPAAWRQASWQSATSATSATKMPPFLVSGGCGVCVWQK